MSAAFEEATAFRFGFRRGALAFWLASLVGFVAYGHLVACMFVDAMPEAPAPLGESVSAAVAVGLAGAVALGAPAALLFGVVMRRLHRRGEWRAALVTGGALSVALQRPRGRRNGGLGIRSRARSVLRHGCGGDDGRRRRRHARWTQRRMGRP